MVTSSNGQDLLEFLTGVTTAFFDNVNREGLVARILDAAIRLTQGDRGSVFLAPDGGPSSQFDTLVATGLGGQPIRVRIDEGVVGHVFRSGEPVLVDDAQSDRRFSSKVDEKTHYQTKSILCVPLRSPKGRVIGVIEILNRRNGKFDARDLQTLQVLSLLAAIALDYRATVDSLSDQNLRLSERIGDRMRSFESIPLRSSNPLLNELFEKLTALAQSDSSILVEGENGTGKEVVAHLLHLRSQRRDKAFVAVNCAAIPEALFEAELFGVAKGAATGTAQRRGKIELASGGTLFLDEIGDLPLAMQAKLLRVLQDRKVTPIGSDEPPRLIDFRIIAATNCDLGELVKRGEVREDLYYRINVIRFRIPPLRERRDDIPGLCEDVLGRFSRERGWKSRTISPSAIKALQRAAWPGNIRQLQNKLEAAVVQAGPRRQLEVHDFELGEIASRPGAAPNAAAPEWERSRTLRFAKRELQKRLIEEALEATRGNKTRAARILGITREGLRKAMRVR